MNKIDNFVNGNIMMMMSIVVVVLIWLLLLLLLMKLNILLRFWGICLRSYWEMCRAIRELFFGAGQDAFGEETYLFNTTQNRFQNHLYGKICINLTKQM